MSFGVVNEKLTQLVIEFAFIFSSRFSPKIYKELQNGCFEC